LKEIVLSIDGQIIMTPALSKAIDNVFDGRVPYDWMYDTTGAEISWLYPGLGAWFTSLNRRNSQLSRWVSNVRPPDFWMTGFFNPQGFLTSMKQEVTRM
jgi:dynein heavy chain